MAILRIVWPNLEVNSAKGLMKIYWDEDLETLPWTEVEAWQEVQVDRFLSGLTGRSSFYRGHLGTSNKTTAICDLPFTTKDDCRLSAERSNHDSPLGANQAVPLSEVIQLISSSGTTGTPLVYGLTRSDLDAWRDGISNTFFTAGVRPDDVFAHLVALPMVAGGLPYADGIRNIGATLAWLGGFPLDRLLRSMRSLGATAMLSTASFAMHITEQCEELVGFKPAELGVKKLLGGGEPGFAQEGIRKGLKAAWGLDHLREMMGLGDVMAAMWAECGAEGGMHFNAQRHVAIEVIDPDTGERLPWEEGVEGELVYTTFTRQATPVLRYRSADHIIVTGVGCSCGRTSPKIRCIGRTDDMLIYKAMNVFPSAIRDVMASAFGDRVEPHIRILKESSAQVRFDRPIPIEVELRSGLSVRDCASVAEDIAEIVRSRLQVRIEVTLLPYRSLPRSAYKTALTSVRPVHPA